MKIKPGFRLRHIADSWLVVPTGAMTKNVPGVLTLSESGALLWQALEQGADKNSLLDIITNEYEIDEATAKKDIIAFLTLLKEKDWLDE